jgi:hypothetical protein
VGAPAGGCWADRGDDYSFVDGDAGLLNAVAAGEAAAARLVMVDAIDDNAARF